MYNRYIPQGDGTYRKRPMPDPAPRPAPPSPPPEPPEHCPEPQPAPCTQCPHRPSGHRPPPRPRQEPPAQTGFAVGSFLKNLLPGNFDTEDLLIVVLLLLMSGDCREDRNLPLLTLALYLFL